MWIVTALLPAAAYGQSCSYYLNATDGDDENSGASPELAVHSFEYAFRTFPSDAVVCMTGGEYFNGLDADGVQLTGPELAGKNMQFVLQRFAGADEVAFTEDELRIDVGDGRVEFVAGSTRSLRFGSGTINSPVDHPGNTTFLHTLVLASGSLDVSGVDLRIDASVGNPGFARDDDAFSAPDSATIARGTGTLVGAPAFEDATRTLTYIGSGDRSTADEVPPLIDRLVFSHLSGTVTVARTPAFAPGSTIELDGAGTARLTSSVTLLETSAPAIIVSGSGELDLSGPLSIVVSQDVPRLAHLNAGGRLTLRDVHVSGPNQPTTTTIANSGSGVLTVHAVEVGSNVDLSIHNEGDGSCRLGTSSTGAMIEADLFNEAGGVCAIEGGTRIPGRIVNKGRLSMLGTLDLATTVENAGSIDLQADLTISGILQNSGDVALGAHSLTISSAGPHQNDGRWSSTGGIVRLASSTTISGEGELPALHSISGAHFISGSHVRGGIVIQPGAQLTLHVGGIDETLSVEGGVGIFQVDRAAALDVDAGSVTLEADLSVGEFVQEAGSSVDLASHTLALTGSFERHGGTFTSSGGGVRFAGSRDQSFDPGPDLVLDHLRIAGTNVRLASGAPAIRDSLIVSRDSKLFLFDHTLRLVGIRSVVLNDGEISTGVAGTLAFSGPAGAEQRISGTGTFGNIDIALEDDDDVVLVDDGDVRQGGILSLSSGRLRLNPGSTYALVSTQGVPLLRRNLGDEDGDGEPAGKTIDANTSTTGSFVTPEEGYHLEYFGVLDGPAVTGTEFLSGRIIDLFVRIAGPSGTLAALGLSGDLSFSGVLELDATALLDVGQFDLSATGDDRAHAIHGSIEGTSGAFVVTGKGVTLAGRAGAPSGIVNFRIESDGHVETKSIRSIAGQLEVSSGIVDLHLGDTDEAGSVGRLLVRAGARVTLASEVRVLEQVILSGGELDLAEFDLVMASGTSLRTAPPALIAPAREGSVVFTGDGRIRTNGTSLPKLRVAPAEASRLVLSGGVRIGESLIIESGVLDLSSHTLTLAGGRWEQLGGEISGDGAISVTGKVDALLATDVVVPTLIVRTSDAETGLALRSANNAPRRVLVSERLSLREGLLDIGSVDVVVGRPGGASVLAYERGTIVMASGDDIADDANGELELSDTEIALDAPFDVSNVRIAGAARFGTGSAALVIRHQITFLDGRLENADSSLVRLADGARVVRRGAGSFLKTPVTLGALDLFYEIRGARLDGGVLPTGPEVRRNLRNLTVDAGSNILQLSEDVDVDEILRLDAGVLDRNGFALRVAAGGTVHYDHSTSTAPTFAGGSFQPAGPVRLIYSGTIDIASSDLTFPSDVTVSDLVVAVGSSSDDVSSFILHENRRIGNLVVVGGNAGSGADLNGRTLLVDSDVHVRSGVLRSVTEAIVEIGDSLVVASEGAVRGFVAVLAQGHTEIRGLFDGHRLRAHGNVTVTGELGSMQGDPTASAEQAVAGLPNLEFSGSDQILRLTRADDRRESIDDAVNRIIMTSGGVVRLEGPDHAPFTLGVNNLELRSGVLETIGADLRLPHDGPGFQRAEDAQSHVAGQISRLLRAGQTGRFEFPVGSRGGSYRPVSVTFTEDDPLATPSVISVGHSGAASGGYLGLPLDGGEDVVIGDVSGFDWTLHATPALPASQAYTLDVVGSGLGAFSAARNLRLVRRSVGEAWEHAWKLEGSATQYDNAVVSLDGEAQPFVQIVQSREGIPAAPEIFAIGIDASELNFARVQVANLMGTPVDVLVEAQTGSVEPATASLAFGEATPYFRVAAGRSDIRLVAESGAVIIRGTLAFEAGRDYLIAALMDGRPRLVTQQARAIPAMDAKEDVSLAFFHGIPDAPPLSLRTRDRLETLFSGIPFARLSDSYAPLPLQNTGFDVIATSTSTSLFSIRSELSGHEGETVTAFAAGHLDPSSPGASEPAQLFLFTNHGRPVQTGVQVAVEEPAEIPAAFALHGNYPNPFNPSTNVVFDLPESADVSLEVFDLLGRSVLRSSTTAMAPGRRTITLDASELPSGVYVYRIAASGSSTHVAGGKMTLVR